MIEKRICYWVELHYERYRCVSALSRAVKAFPARNRSHAVSL